MTQRMLIDATQPEEIRVVVHKGDRIEDFDYETANKKQLKGNIYLAKVTRVEPSLQAAFVEYGGNRHGFLPFSEIHPDYYRIPIADREALIEAEKAALRAGDDDDVVEEEDEEKSNAKSGARKRGGRRRGGRGRAARAKAPDALQQEPSQTADQEDPQIQEPQARATAAVEAPEGPEDAQEDAQVEAQAEGTGNDEAATTAHAGPEESANSEESAASEDSDASPEENDASDGEDDASDDEDGPAAHRNAGDLQEVEAEANVDSIGDDEVADAEERRAQLLRRYKIQEVIKRRQIILIQVTKEERGNKGAALTTYLSLAGRYCVLMPNTNKGGGISRKISNTSDRRRLKKVLAELEIPEGIAVIVRTAGSQRSKAEIRRDYEYLMRLWNEIRDNTMQASAPALIHEEANLIKRAIRDLYNRDMDEILVEGEGGYKAAKAFMKSLMPSHARKVQLYKDNIPLYQRYRVERHLDAMHLPTVQLRSGGYIVLNTTEALVAIDVNSGKATRERNIEETALKTNLEAAEEVGRQLRLRDLAGLVVIDFIDMEDQRHNREVERKLKESLRSDRARLQLGRISPFGLLEMSRQRLRPSLFENSTALCSHCNGTGHVRTPESAALQILRNLEEEGLRQQGGELVVSAPTEVALYLLNQKRANLSQMETRYGFQVVVQADNSISTAEMKLERSGRGDAGRSSIIIGEESSDTSSNGNRRRGRRRGRWSDNQSDVSEDESPVIDAEARLNGRADDQAANGAAEESNGESRGEEKRGAESQNGDDEERPKKRRRRGKRGGRRRSRRGDEAVTAEGAQEQDQKADQAGEATEQPVSENEAGAVVETDQPPMAGSAAEPVAEADAPADTATAEGAEEEQPKPARAPRRRSSGSGRGRRPKAAAAAKSEPAENAKSEAPVTEAPLPAAATNGESQPVMAEPQSIAEPQPVSQPEAAPEPTPVEEVVAEVVADAPPRPKKRGWWNKLLDT